MSAGRITIRAEQTGGIAQTRNFIIHRQTLFVVEKMSLLNRP